MFFWLCIYLSLSVKKNPSTTIINSDSVNVWNDGQATSQMSVSSGNSTLKVKKIILIVQKYWYKEQVHDFVKGNAQFIFLCDVCLVKNIRKHCRKKSNGLFL